MPRSPPGARSSWIHPFLDGNGRIARLFTDAYLAAGGIKGDGLWSASRGLARQRAEYLDRLAAADAPRRGDLDGRGHLTLAGLIDFCRFFLATCIDQARYMGDFLRTDEMERRIAAYVQLRAAGTLPGPPLKPASAPVLLAVFLRGALARGEAAALTGYGERAGRAVLAALLAEGLLVCDSAKGPAPGAADGGGALSVSGGVSGGWLTVKVAQRPCGSGFSRDETSRVVRASRVAAPLGRG